MSLTRRNLIAGAGAGMAAATLGPIAFAQVAPALTWIGKSRNEFAGLQKEAFADGHRFLSLSIYGPTHAPLYAAVMIKRPAPADQRHWPAMSAADLQRALDEQAKQGYGPVIVTATGSAASPLFAAVFEPQNPLALTRLMLKSGSEEDSATFQGVDRNARKNGLILRWAALYGSGAGTRVAAIWVPNPDRVVWNDDGVAETAAEFVARRRAHGSAWCRPAFVTLNQDGRYFSLFVDSQVDHWVGEHDLTAAALQEQVDAWGQKGYHPICVQASGATAAAARFAAVLVHDEKIAPKVWTATGPVTNAGIDEVMRSIMTKSVIRQASLAIVKGSRLIYARGYTFAERGWPITQPTTHFRVGSCSKFIPALGIYKLIEQGKLKLSDRLQDVLKLRTPAGAAPKDRRFGEITVEHLLAHRSGLDGNAFTHSADVRSAFAAAQRGKTWHLPVTAEMTDSYVASLNLVGNPGEKYAYNNCGYYLLGRIVARMRGTPTLIAAMEPHCFDPLGIKRIRGARSLIADQLLDEARYSTNSNRDRQRDIPLWPSVVSDGQPLVPIGYGTQPLEVAEGAGGVSPALTDLARLIAIMIDKNDNPALRRDTVRQMLTRAAATKGHGLDAARDLGKDRFYGFKGGSLSTSWSVFQFNGEFGFTVSWAGPCDKDVPWYPNFPAVMNIATKADWGATDLFPEFGMVPL
jgi:CubicO group peptidase (beta-lactamase class C family)